MPTPRSLQGGGPRRRLITDPAELDDLPDRTVILDAMGRPMQLMRQPLGDSGIRTIGDPAGAVACHRPAPSVMTFPINAGCIELS